MQCMTFISPLFFLFLLIIVFFNYYSPSPFRPVLLVVASFIFIGFYNLESLITLVILTLFNFYSAKQVANYRILYISILVLNVSTIILFNFFSVTSNVIGFSVSNLHFSLYNFFIALGLSYYSLQNIAYITEVRFKRLQPETPLSNYFLYSSFFPKAISGPVMLPNEFLPQIEKTAVTSSDLIIGFKRILLGLFKKMVIADRLVAAVGSIFDFNSDYAGMTTIVGAYLFTIQMYFDFSGYTDMALGAAKMLGYDLKDNFDTPLRSTSISEFWRRWHISLIAFFTKYIYYPLVFKLREYKKIAALVGIALTFIVSGLWHRIGLTFFCWAMCHVFYLSFELLTKRFRIKLSEQINKTFYKLFSVFIVFNLVCFSNIFFRAHSVSHAFHLIKNSFTRFIPSDWLSGFIAPLAVGGHQIDEFNFFISIMMTLLVLLFEKGINSFSKKPVFNITYSVVVLLLIMIFGVFNSGTRFIYMQF